MKCLGQRRSFVLQKDLPTFLFSSESITYCRRYDMPRPLRPNMKRSTYPRREEEVRIAPHLQSGMHPAVWFGLHAVVTQI